jgi:hypothetical protein
MISLVGQMKVGTSEKLRKSGQQGGLLRESGEEKPNEAWARVRNGALQKNRRERRRRAGRKKSSGGKSKARKKSRGNKT